MKTILVIEDEKEVCDCIRPLFERDYKARVVHTGKDGLCILDNEKISLVILDYILPDINGIEILKYIKDKYKIPVIVITAYGDKEVVLKCLKHHADWYFDKPFSLKALKEKVGEMLNRKEHSKSGILLFEKFGLDPLKLSPDIIKALEFIGARMSEPRRIFKTTLKEVSEATSVSPRHLSILLKKECGMSFSYMIASLKVSTARELLSQEIDIKEIADKLGYNTPKNFSRFIKCQTGKSPSEQRKKIT